MLAAYQFNSVHNTGRKTKAELLAGVESVESKLIARNTVRYKLANGESRVRLHRTDILTTLPNGAIQLNSGGWKTVTTKARLNGLLPSGWGVFADKGAWIVRTPKGEFPFADGITFWPDGRLFGGTSTAAELAAARAQQRVDERLIKRYCAKVANDPWPTDSRGDPFVWPDPETGKYAPDMVRSFLDEQYVFLTMFSHVQQWSGMGDMWMAQLYHRDQPGSDGRKRFASKVRRYLRACLGYAS